MAEEQHDTGLSFLRQRDHDTAHAYWEVEEYDLNFAKKWHNQNLKNGSNILSYLN